VAEVHQADGVSRLQEMLKQTGHYGGRPSGVFDAETEAAVRGFQRAAGLKVDGRPGGQTLLKLYLQAGGRLARYSAPAANSGVGR
jgi:peptidoglycan hydrolase-like protein with peptidoglycan-binding domain